MTPPAEPAGDDSAPRVYVVIAGLYEERDLVGVYGTSEAAMEAHPVRREPRRGHSSIERGGGWQLDDDANPRSWSNGLDWDEYKEIREYEVRGEIRPEDEIPGLVR